MIVKAVFDTKPNSGYDDDLPHRYHFPARGNYMAAALAARGDWVVLREPRRNRGRRACVAVARVLDVRPDPLRPDHAYAILGDYLPFDLPVPFVGQAGYWEASLRAILDASRVGAGVQGRAMRPLEDADFAALVLAGLSETLEPSNARRLGPPGGFQEFGEPFVFDAPPAEQARRVEAILINRKIRDANFRRQVCEAYDDRCAVTRLRIINGGGRSEVQAAHIWPVGEGGPDTVQNGIALSGTIHWLFDRHLISLTDDYRLLVSHNKVPNELRGLFASQMDRIHLPDDPRLRPHPAYVARHRQAFADT
jgi:putative restriction endonuclease